jgi:phosphopantothenoylcysteine decarboxylase/phosphopantothenate--cysteine ligase
MYEHAATQDNLGLLRARGVAIVAPEVGRLATKDEWGVGRMAEPPELLAACEALAPPVGPRPLDGLRVLVTAGGTREPIDSVRFLGNRSSGRMGFALAEEAAARGAEVTVVAANVSLPRDPRVRYVDVSTAAELQEACEREFPGCHVLLMAAAVADFRPVDPAEAKLKKDQVGDELRLDLERTPDVLAALAGRRVAGQTLVGFAAEHGEGAVEYGRSKLRAKSLDAVVVNDIARAEIGFDSRDNEVTIVSAGHERSVALADKRQVAAAILDAVLELRARPAETPA